MRTSMRIPLLSLFVAALFVGSGPFLTQAKVPNDPFYAEQWYLSAIGAEQAWEFTTGSRDVIVAVIDTAVDTGHEDLQPNIWVNTDEIFGNGIDDDGNGFIDDINGWNFEKDTWDVRPDPNGSDELGYVHGTLVASLIGAKGDNGSGIAGVAWNVRIMPVVALDAEGNGYTTDVANAIRYAVDNGASIINLSLEGYGNAPAIEEALSYAREHGVLTVAAAGNADVMEGDDLDKEPVFPACLSHDPSFGVFGVGSLNRDGQKAAYANIGSCILVSAPGEEIFGARPTVTRSEGTEGVVAGYEGDFSGTSLATPLVSGAAALLKSVRPDWGWAELREWLLSSATPVDHLQDPAFRTRIGRGQLNIGTALAGVPNPVALSGAIPSDASSATTPAEAPTPSVAATDPRAAAAAEAIAIDLGTAGTLVRVELGAGLMLAEGTGGRAWGIAPNGTVTLLHPYGTGYRAGLSAVAVPGGVAFAPRGGGGHLVVMDLGGHRLISVFPFGKEARGRWSVAVTPASATAPAELVMSGPLGARALALDRLGAEGWRSVARQE